MFSAHCHCHNIQLVADQAPQSITHCNCSICNRLGAQWAYYSSEEVKVSCESSMADYQWGDKTLTFHFCPKCSCTTHYTTLKKDGKQLLAINTRMNDPSATNHISKRYFDGADTWQFVDHAF